MNVKIWKADYLSCVMQT